MNEQPPVVSPPPDERLNAVPVGYEQPELPYEGGLFAAEPAPTITEVQAAPEPPIAAEPGDSEEPDPITDIELQKKMAIGLLDDSKNAINESTEQIEKSLAEKSRGKGIKGFVKKIWYGNIGRDPLRLIGIEKNRKIIQEQGIGALTKVTREQRNAEMAATVERIVNRDWLEDGEHKQALSEIEHGSELETKIVELVGKYGSGSMELDELEEEKTRFLSEFGSKLSDEDRNKGLLFADNIVTVAKNARLMHENGIAMERILDAISVVGGTAETGVETEIKLQAIDKIMNKLYQHRVGTLVNETTAALVIGTAMTVAKFTTRKAVTATAAFVSLGLGAGIVAAARERLHIGQERTQHMRERAVGGEVDEGSKRRDKLEATRYETVGATELTSQLRLAQEAVDAANPASISEGLATIAAIQARKELSAEKSIDLIDYTGKNTVEQERLQLLVAMAESKVAISKAMEGLSNDELLAMGITSMDVDAVVGELSLSARELLVEDVTAKDKAFSKLRNSQTLKFGLIGVATSLVGGEIFQEVHAAFSDDMQGVFEGADSEQTRRSLLAGWFRDHNTQASGGAAGAAGLLHHSALGKNASLGLPPDYKLTHGAGGNYELLDKSGNVIDGNITLDPSGHISTGSLNELHDKGFGINSHTETYTTTTVNHDMVTHGPHKYLQQHPNQFTSIDRHVWYDNNTPGTFDKNELKMDWGSENGTGIDAQGNYVFNVSHMLPDGSYHDGLSANAKNLAHQGKLAIALSMTHDTQKHVFMVNIDANGNARIDSKSWFGRSLFENRDGRAHYIGGYAETVEKMGVTHQGHESVRMLATIVGENNPNPAGDPTPHVITTVHERLVTDLSPPSVGELPIEVPPITPIYARSGLEELRRPEEAVNPAETGPYSESYIGDDSEREREWEEERSPRLKENPEARLQTKQELDWYHDEALRRRGQEYIDEIDANIAGSPELNDLGGGTRAIVVMPVAALKEAENIYNALSLYSKQPSESLEKATILLSLNWKEAKLREPGGQESLDATLKEIERARQDFPNLKIATFQKEWSTEWDENIRKGKIYGEVIKTLYDTAAFAVRKSINEGTMAADQEVLLITNDADAEGIAWNYFDRYIEEADDNPELDALVGQIRWGTNSYFDYPGYGVSNWAMQVMNLMTTRAKGYGVKPATIGPNAAFRLSAYAAVGGCIDKSDMGAGADSELGRKILSGRGIKAGRSRGGYGPYVVDEDKTGGNRTKSGRRVIGVATGAEVDSAPDRLLGMYQTKKWIGSAWTDFDAGAERDKLQKSGVELLKPENVKTEFPEIRSRIERQISDFITWWYPDAGLATFSLNLLFPDVGSERAWTLLPSEVRDASGNSKTHYAFKYTSVGAKALKSRMLNMEDGRNFATQHKHALYTGPSPTMVRPTLA